MAMPENTEADHLHTNGDMKLEECVDSPVSDVDSIASGEGDIGDANAKIEHMTQMNGYQRVRYQKIPQRTRTEELDWKNLDKKLTKLGTSDCVVHSLSEKELTLIHSVTPQEFNVDENQNKAEPTFAGRRDVSSPRTLQERTIVSRRGSVRGYKNRVRAGIATFLEQQHGDKQRNYAQIEKGKIVIYTSSMTIVRETFDRCSHAKKILQNHMVRYEEKDLFMSVENQKELRERLGVSQVVLPQVFADGVSLGGLEQLVNLNEDGELRKLFDNFTKINVRSSCDKCGGYRFVPCTFCHGSKKSLKRNYFTEEFSALRCMQCDENGLLRCDLCLDQQE